MSIAAFVTGGIGPGASIALYVPDGLGIGEAIEPEAQQTGGGYLPPKRKRKAQRPDYEKRDEEARELQAALERAYAEITGEAPETPAEKELSREVVATVRPFTQGRPKRPPPVAKVDFAAMARNAERAAKLLDLLEQRRDEEEAAVTLLLM